MYRQLATGRTNSLLTCLHAMSKLFLTVKFFLVVSVVGFVVSIFWIGFVQQPVQCVNETVIRDALDDAALDPRYAEVYRKSTRLPNDTKYVLLWMAADFAPFTFLGRGQRGFIASNCSVINCYVTDDRAFFGGDLTKFHAVAFNGRNLLGFPKSKLPKSRCPSQKYIYFNMESADNYPVCDPVYDGYFNWTSTYRLDSDIPFPYFTIKNRHGSAVGPRRDMSWERGMILDESYADSLRNKSIAAAWFVSNCKSRSDRNKFVKQLQLKLKKHGHRVDIYGNCGPLKCPKGTNAKCEKLLEDKYYFYMSMENSFSEDYVTEKLLTALQHDLVPVVYGGANYTSFLPPNSYIDARALTLDALAAKMAALIREPDLYKQYFYWKSYYTYHDAKSTDDVCAVCDALNDDAAYARQTIYKDFRRWWNPDYEKRCKPTKKIMYKPRQ